MNASNATFSCRFYEPESTVSTVFKAMSVVFVSVFGLCGNAFTILLAVKYTVRKSLHHLIVNMAIADSVFILTLSLFALTQHLSYGTFSLFPRGLFGSFLCKGSFFLIYVSCPVSFITLLVISIERFRVTRVTVHRSRPSTLRKRSAVIALSWWIPLASYGVTLHYANLSPRLTCFVSKKHYIFFFISNHLITCLFCVIIILSILTIRGLSDAKDFQANSNAKQQSLRTKRIKSAVNMVLCSTLLGVFCWVPYFVYTTLFFMESHFGIKTLSSSACYDGNSLLFFIGYFLPLVNSSFSPCIYIVFLSDFREAARSILCRKRSSLLGNGSRNSFELISPEQPKTKRNRGRKGTHFEQEFRATRTDYI